MSSDTLNIYSNFLEHPPIEKGVIDTIGKRKLSKERWKKIPLERDIEKKVKDYAESKDWLTRKWTSPGHAFVPDQIFIRPDGKIIFIEFKATGKEPTAGQLREHGRLRGHGCLVYVIDSIAAGKALVDHYANP